MADVKKIATRDSYGKALAALGEEHPDLVVLDADLAGATKTATFQKAFPDRHFDCGIAEANMVCVAAGMVAILMTMASMPSAFKVSAASRASATIRPLAIMATSLPSFRTSPLPISNLYESSNITGTGSLPSLM